MRLLLIGDIVGKPGRQIVCRALKPLIEREQLDLVVANAENAAGGSGIAPPIYHELIDAGVDVITLGDHIYRRAEIYEVLRTETRIVKPANYPAEALGAEMRGGAGSQRRFGRRVQPAGPGVHAAGRLSVQSGRPRAGLAAERGPRDSARLSRRSHQRQASDGPLPRRPRLRRVGHAHPRAHRRRVHLSRAAPPFSATSA